MYKQLKKTWYKKVDKEFIQSRDHQGNTLLINAIQKNDMDVAEYLLDHDPPMINCKNNQNATAIHAAVNTNNLDAVEYLLSRGADITITSNDDQNDANIKVIELLINHDLSKHDL